MKPIDQMTLPECLEVLQSAEGDAFVGMRLNISALADRIHELTRWIPVSERMPTEEDGDRYGLVLKWDSITGSVQVDSWNHFGTHNVCFTHWQRITPPEDK
jgi:hypothetical protein